MYAKLYHLRRPGKCDLRFVLMIFKKASSQNTKTNLFLPIKLGIWSQDDYLFLYRAVEQLVSQLNLSDHLNESSPFGSQLNMNGHMNGHIIRSDHSIKSESIA